MAEVVRVFGWLELGEDGLEAVADGVERTRVHRSKQSFDLGKDLLDRIEVRAVGRQVQELHPGVFKALSDAGRLVRGEIIDDDDASRLHFRDQAFLEPLAKDRAGHGAWEQLRRQDGIVRQPRDEGRRQPVAVRGLGEQFLALMTPAMAAGHRRVRAGLIDKYQRGRVEVRLCRPPEFTRQSNVGPVLFSREDRFF